MLYAQYQQSKLIYLCQQNPKIYSISIGITQPLSCIFIHRFFCILLLNCSDLNKNKPIRMCFCVCFVCIFVYIILLFQSNIIIVCWMVVIIWYHSIVWNKYVLHSMSLYLTKKIYGTIPKSQSIIAIESLLQIFFFIPTAYVLPVHLFAYAYIPGFFLFCSRYWLYIKEQIRIQNILPTFMEH